MTKQYLGVFRFRGNLRVVLGVAMRILVSKKWQERTLVVIKFDLSNHLLVGKGELNVA